METKQLVNELFCFCSSKGKLTRWETHGFPTTFLHGRDAVASLPTHPSFNSRQLLKRNSLLQEGISFQ